MQNSFVDGSIYISDGNINFTILFSQGHGPRWSKQQLRQGLERGLVVQRLFIFFFFNQTIHDRYNVCHNAHPTGHSTAKKRRGNGKYVDYYRGGARGDTFQSWAEAEYLLLPSF